MLSTAFLRCNMGVTAALAHSSKYLCTLSRRNIFMAMKGQELYWASIFVIIRLHASPNLLSCRRRWVSKQLFESRKCFGCSSKNEYKLFFLEILTPRISKPKVINEPIFLQLGLNIFWDALLYSIRTVSTDLESKNYFNILYNFILVPSNAFL